MNEKLTEATILALQNKLVESETNNKDYYKEFSKKVRTILRSLLQQADVHEYRKDNIITFDVYQKYLIDRKDCQNYIQQKAPCSIKQYVDYEYQDGKYIYNDLYKQAEQYVDTEYIPTLKEYMDSKNKSCEDLIKQTFQDNNIEIKDIQTQLEDEIKSFSSSDNPSDNAYKNQYIKSIVNAINKGWENRYELYPYQYKYIVTIDIQDNINIDTSVGDYKVSYNPNYREYTVRGINDGKVYFASLDAKEAYAELDRLNKGGEKGTPLKPHNWWE